MQRESPHDAQKNKYYDRIADVLEGPYRSYMPKFPNIYTMGDKLPSFQQVGFLFRPESDPNFNSDDSNSNRMPLFSRPRYSGSDQHEYYTMSGGIKIPISKDRKEIQDDEKLQISGYTGDFDVQIYDTDTQRYNPWA